MDLVDLKGYVVVVSQRQNSNYSVLLSKHLHRNEAGIVDDVLTLGGYLAVGGGATCGGVVALVIGALFVSEVEMVTLGGEEDNGPGVGCLFFEAK